MEATLQIFIKALNNFLKQTEYKEYKVSDRQFVYLLANKSVVSVLIRKDLGKNHIIVEEIFDTDAEKSELEYFCKNIIQSGSHFLALTEQLCNKEHLKEFHNLKQY